jgi:hypothetical protein
MELSIEMSVEKQKQDTFTVSQLLNYLGLDVLTAVVMKR